MKENEDQTVLLRKVRHKKLVYSSYMAVNSIIVLRR